MHPHGVSHKPTAHCSIVFYWNLFIVQLSCPGYPEQSPSWQAWYAKKAKRTSSKGATVLPLKPKLELWFQEPCQACRGGSVAVPGYPLTSVHVRTARLLEVSVSAKQQIKLQISDRLKKSSKNRLQLADFAHVLTKTYGFSALYLKKKIIDFSSLEKKSSKLWAHIFTTFFVSSWNVYFRCLFSWGRTWVIVA